MRTYLQFLAIAVCSAFRSRRDLVLENLALRQQLAVYLRQSRRPQLRDHDLRFWSLLARTWSGWRSVLVIVEPDTVVRWHRTAWRRYWTWIKKRPEPWPTTDSYRATGPHWAHRDRKCAVGLASRPGRTARPRLRRQRGDGATLPTAGPAASTVAVLAILPHRSPPAAVGR